VQVAIRDNGPGIELENQSRIFEPFFTTKDVGQGRGLGLTVSYQTIVNQHHGQLNVTSKPGHGAEFILEIPLRHSQSLASDLSAPTSMTMGVHQKNTAMKEHSSGFGTTETSSLRPNTQPIAAVTNSGC
jgi:hypothetical protein